MSMVPQADRQRAEDDGAAASVDSVGPNQPASLAPTDSEERPGVKKAGDPREVDTVAPPRSGVQHAIPLPGPPPLPRESSPPGKFETCSGRGSGRVKLR